MPVELKFPNMSKSDTVVFISEGKRRISSILFIHFELVHFNGRVYCEATFGRSIWDKRYLLVLNFTSFLSRCEIDRRECEIKHVEIEVYKEPLPACKKRFNTMHKCIHKLEETVNWIFHDKQFCQNLQSLVLKLWGMHVSTRILTKVSHLKWPLIVVFNLQ